MTKMTNHEAMQRINVALRHGAVIRNVKTAWVVAAAVRTPIAKGAR